MLRPRLQRAVRVLKRTLIEEHSPASWASLQPFSPASRWSPSDAVVGRLQWVGYANFDLKYDPRDGSVKFFELNPRLGRSNYYVTGTGHNAVSYYVDGIRDTLAARRPRPRVHR